LVGGFLLSPWFVTPWIFPHKLVELILVVFPQQIRQGLDELDDLPGELGFLFPWVYHPFTPWLSFQCFDLEDHLRADGSFLIEHGIGEGGFGDGSYFSGYAERDLMDGLEGLI
jgi:hypothetical protein